MKNILILCVFLFSSWVGKANDSDLKRLSEMCAASMASTKLNYSLILYHTKDGTRRLTDKITVKRKDKELFLDQSEFTIVSNKNLLVQINKSRKTIEVSKPNDQLADNLFKSFNPSTFYQEMDTVYIDPDYKDGTRFIVKFKATSAYDWEEIYFTPDHKVKQISIYKNTLDPLLGTLKTESMDFEYEFISEENIQSKVDFSTENIFKDESKLILTEQYKGYQLINYQKQ